MVRADVKTYFGIGRGALALRWTEARAKDRIAPFQLGGATEAGKAIGFNLGNRELALRGYKGDEPQLLGREARLASAEVRFPIVDIDRHGMVPPFGINRLSGTVFFDAGGAWDTGNGPLKYYRGTGFELRGETKLLYVLGLDIRLGVGHALDAIPGRSRTRGYFTLGQSF
jgi:outer membrane protein assembly factor BamA